MKHFLLLVISILFFACAKQTSPTGGPQDTIPPILKDSYPKKEQTQFKQKTVQLTFDELITLDNPKEQIIIIPDVGKEYEITSRKTTVKLTFEKDLKDSTTYSINFRDAVKDLTEKNPAENLKLAFSTGPYVDSLIIRGSVTLLLQDKPLKDITIALYASDTFNIFKHKPIYLTKSDEKGKFAIENLKHGTYYIYAIEDKNRNLITDSKTEPYGFLADSILLSQNKNDVNIPLIKLDARPLKLTSKRPYNTYVNIKTTKGLQQYTLTTPNQELISTFGEDHSNIRIYNTFSTKDSLLVEFHAIDSIQNKLDSTFYIKFADRNAKPEAFDFKKERLSLIFEKGLMQGTYSFTKPVGDINFDSIYYQVDSLHRLNFTAEDFKWNATDKKMTISKKIDKSLFPAPNTDPLQGPPKPAQSSKPKQLPTFYLGHGAFISIERDSSAKVAEILAPTRFESTGALHVTINTKEEYFILELLDKAFQPLRSIANTKKCSFEDLQPGEYQLRLIIDKDKNQSWSAGNFFKRTEPEPILLYRGEKKNPVIDLKANFEIDVLITY